MATKKMSFGARVDVGANRIANKMRAGRAARMAGEPSASRGVELAKKADAAAAQGAIKQRELDEAVRAVGGKSSRAVSDARAAAQGIRGRSGVFTGERIQRLETPMGRRLLKGAMRGMLSPAGLAEGVAGAAVKAMKDSGTYDNARKSMLKAGKSKPVRGTRRGERA